MMTPAVHNAHINVYIQTTALTEEIQAAPVCRGHGEEVTKLQNAMADLREGDFSLGQPIYYRCRKVVILGEIQKEQREGSNLVN